MEDKIKKYILEAISTHKIGSQYALLRLLKEHGLRVSQPTLSRTLHNLNIAKVSGHYSVTPSNTLGVALATPLQHTEHGLIIAHTPPGGASSLAALFDQNRDILGILGTIAGDDTVLIITNNKQEAITAKKKIYYLFPHLEQKV